MNPVQSNSLELRDIHLPEPVSWWPLAPGWWILLILIIALVIIIYFYAPKLIKIIKHQTPQKLAQTEFKIIQQSYLSHKNNQTLIQSLSVLLRRICMTYESRSNIASLTGQAWKNSLNKLNTQQGLSDEYLQLLITAPYQKHSEFDADTLIRQCESWIDNLPKEASHASD